MAQNRGRSPLCRGARRHRKHPRHPRDDAMVTREAVIIGSVVVAVAFAFAVTLAVVSR